MSIPPAVGLAITLLSTGMQVAGQIQQAKQQSAVSEYNAKVAEQNAVAAKQKAEYDEELHRERVRKLLSSQRAQYGASGVDMTGSPLLVLQDTAGEGELDALAIRYGGDVESIKQKNEANLYRLQGSSALKAGYTGAGTTLLTSGSKIANTFTYNKGSLEYRK